MRSAQDVEETSNVNLDDGKQENEEEGTFYPVVQTNLKTFYPAKVVANEHIVLFAVEKAKEKESYEAGNVKLRLSAN